MTNTDMIVWQANAAASITGDYWSTSNFADPRKDSTQNVQTTYVVNTNNTVSFTTVRDMNSKDPKDFVM